VYLLEWERKKGHEESKRGEGKKERKKRRQTAFLCSLFRGQGHHPGKEEKKKNQEEGEKKDCPGQILCISM